jgi:TRAP-type C4-dicarboxylate transport system substrate-binding protein
MSTPNKEAIINKTTRLIMSARATDAAGEDDFREIIKSAIEEATEDLRELREGDNKLIRALAADAGIEITAPDHMLGAQWEQFHDGVMKLSSAAQS